MKYLFIMLFSVSLFACKKKGCTDPLAVNYDASAEKNEGAIQFQNDGVIGFILKTSDIPPSDASQSLLAVNEFIDIENYTQYVPECGGGVWSYYESDGVYAYLHVLKLYAVTQTDTSIVQSISVSYANGGPGNETCTKRAILHP